MPRWILFTTLEVTTDPFPFSNEKASVGMLSKKSTAADPYQPAEAEEHVTKAICLHVRWKQLDFTFHHSKLDMTIVVQKGFAPLAFKLLFFLKQVTSFMYERAGNHIHLKASFFWVMNYTDPSHLISSPVKWDLTKWPLSEAFSSNANSKISWVWKSEVHKSKSAILFEESQHRAKTSW